MQESDKSSPETQATVTANGSSVQTLIQDTSPEALRRIVTNPGLSEDLALSLLKHSDLPSAVIEELARNTSAMQSHRVRARLACHPHTPRHIAIQLVRQLYTFELMQVALTPGALPEVVMAAEQAILMRVEKIAAGERITLARQGSGRIAAALLQDPEARVIEAALNNPRATEDVIVKALMSPKSPQALLELVCHHAKWSLRPEIREALLRHQSLPLARALEIAKLLPTRSLRAVLHDSRLKENIRTYLQKEVQQRGGTPG